MKKFLAARFLIYVAIIDLGPDLVKHFFKKIAFIFANNQGQIGAAK